MESIKEFLHIDLKWQKDDFKKRTWNLTFDNEKIMTINQGSWFFRNFFNVESDAGFWIIRRIGKGPYLYEIRNRSLVGGKLFEIGFKNRFTLGMFNPTAADNFNWKALEGGGGYGWYQDGLEVVRFEKIGRSFTQFNYNASVVNGRVNEKWLTAMLVAGYIALS